MAKLIFSLFSVMNRLLQLLQHWNTYRQIRKMYRNEQIAKQQKKLQQASKFVAMLGLLLSITLTNGCKTTATAVTDIDCDVFQLVRWSKKDTLKTVDQVKEHNAVWQSLCH